MAADSSPESSSGSWWKTLPGVLTAVAGLLTAVTGLVVAINQISGGSDKGSSSPTEAARQVDTAMGVDTVPSSGGEGVRTRVTFPSGRRATVGDYLYEVRDAQISDRNPGELDLKFAVRVTNNSAYPLNFWDRSFRLLVGGAQRAPIGGLNDVVQGRSSGDGTVEFVVPNSARQLTLVVGDTDDKSVKLPFVLGG
jgi:hypothetical protein